MWSKAISLLALPFMLALVPSALAASLDNKFLGTYESTERSFVNLKRFTFSREKDGTIKARASLAGFPEEVSLGETTAEPYSDRNNRDMLVCVMARFPSEKYKPIVVIHPGTFENNQLQYMNYTCYMKDVDGSNIQFDGQLSRVK